MPQLDPTFYVAQLFWLVLSFGFLWAIMHFILLPRVRTFVEKRVGIIDGILAQAEKIEQEAEALAHQNDLHLKAMQKKNSDLLQSETRRLEKKMHAFLQEKNKEYEQTIHETTQFIESKKEDIQLELEEAIPEPRSSR